MKARIKALAAGEQLGPLSDPLEKGPGVLLG